MISLVTISYNQAAYLESTIESVLDQMTEDVEYIVVDGGSTDGSLEILEKYRKRITKVVIGRDRGPADALNIGFSHARGELLGFLNSDDTLLAGGLATVAKMAAEHPEIDVFSGHALVIDGTGAVLRKTYSDRFSMRRMLFDGCILIQPATFFRRHVFAQSGGFNINNRISWDSELFMRFGAAGAKYMLIDRFIATYRVHETSITGGDAMKEERERQRRRVFEENYGRPWRGSDDCARLFYRYWRKFWNPRDTLQRIIGGPIGGRYDSRRKKRFGIGL